MKAIRVSVGFHERFKVEYFLARFKGEEKIFIYRADNVTFVAVTGGECMMAWFRAEVAAAFEEVMVVELR